MPKDDIQHSRFQRAMRQTALASSLVMDRLASRIAQLEAAILADTGIHAEDPADVQRLQSLDHLLQSVVELQAFYMRLAEVETEAALGAAICQIKLEEIRSLFMARGVETDRESTDEGQVFLFD